MNMNMDMNNEQHACMLLCKLHNEFRNNANPSHSTAIWSLTSLHSGDFPRFREIHMWRVHAPLIPSLNLAASGSGTGPSWSTWLCRAYLLQSVYVTDVSVTERICHRAYLLWSVSVTERICYRAYLLQSVSVTERICYRAYLLLSVSDTERICYWAYLLQSVFVTQNICYRAYMLQSISVTCVSVTERMCHWEYLL